MLQAFILLINTLLSAPNVDQNMIDAAIASQPVGYTTTYDAATGSATVTAPTGGQIVIDPLEND